MMCFWVFFFEDVEPLKRSQYSTFMSSWVHEKKPIKTDRFPMNLIIPNLFPNMLHTLRRKMLTWNI